MPVVDGSVCGEFVFAGVPAPAVPLGDAEYRRVAYSSGLFQGPG